MKPNKTSEAVEAIDSEVRMLFDLETPSSSLEIDTIPSDAGVPLYDVGISSSLSLNRNLVDEPIILIPRDHNDSFQVFNASLVNFDVNFSDESSPESAFSDAGRDGLSPILTWEETFAPKTNEFAGCDTSHLSGQKYDDLSRDVMDVMALLTSKEESAMPQTCTNPLDPTFYDPTMSSLNDLDPQVASLAGFTADLPPYLHSPHASLATPNLFCSFTAPHQMPYQQQSSNVAKFSNSGFANSASVFNSGEGRVVSQLAPLQCHGDKCNPNTFQIKLPQIKGVKGGENGEVSLDKAMNNVGVDNFVTIEALAQKTDTTTVKKARKMDPTSEPGAIGVFKPGTRRAKSNELSKAPFHQSTYAFKPPTEYLVKAWQVQQPSNASDSNRGASQTQSQIKLHTPRQKRKPHVRKEFQLTFAAESILKNTATDKNQKKNKVPKKTSGPGQPEVLEQSQITAPENSQEFKPLPTMVHLGLMSAGQRWNMYKDRYTQSKLAHLNEATVSPHCSTMFKDLDSYVDHLESHRVSHGIFCPDEDCPLALIGFKTKLELRRHIRYDHLKQLDPYLSTHIDEILKDDVTREMFNSVYTCKINNCWKTFYRLDTLKRHQKTKHTENATPMKRSPKLTTPKPDKARPSLKQPVHKVLA